jgi:outer membrane protein OmpA-like peptidoglycan-associated protein
MTKTVILLLLFVSANYALSQSPGKSGISMSQCDGAINIFEDGDFQLQFTGKKGTGGLIDAYPSLSSKILSRNAIWISYIAPSNGDLTFDALIASGYLQMVVFEEVAGDICGEIASAESEMMRLHTGTTDSHVGLAYEIGGGVLYSLPMRKGRKVQLLLVTNEESTEDLSLKWDFIEAVISKTETKIVDRRFDDFAPTFRVIVKDGETNEPLIVNLSIEGLYVGSEFMFNVERNSHLSIKCDVEGYFFSDQEEYVTSFEDHEMVVILERVSAGKTMAIEELEFRPGSSEIVKSSEPKLRRLKDFLALNAKLNIEIQGHVHALGKNSMAGQKISEARAKRVMKFLITNGIDKGRLTAVGFGNTRPVYPEPEFFYEEQANRRVEIVVR